MKVLLLHIEQLSLQFLFFFVDGSQVISHELFDVDLVITSASCVCLEFVLALRS